MALPMNRQVLVLPTSKTDEVLSISKTFCIHIHILRNSLYVELVVVDLNLAYSPPRLVAHPVHLPAYASSVEFTCLIRSKDCLLAILKTIAYP